MPRSSTNMPSVNRKLQYQPSKSPAQVNCAEVTSAQIKFNNHGGQATVGFSRKSNPKGPDAMSFSAIDGDISDYIDSIINVTDDFSTDELRTYLASEGPPHGRCDRRDLDSARRAL